MHLLSGFAGSIAGHFLYGLMVTYLFSPVGLVVMAVALLIAGFAWFPAFTLARLKDVRTWLLVFAIGVGLFAFHLNTELATVKAQNATTQQTLAATNASVQSLNTKITLNKQTVAKTTRLHQIARSAPEGKKEDAVLDQVSQDDAQPAAGGSRDTPADGVLDRIAHRP